MTLLTEAPPAAPGRPGHGHRRRTTERSFGVSFEFFPPKSEAAEVAVWGAIERLARLRPRFVSVTYGAGGSTRDRSLQMIERLVTDTSFTPAAHLTTVGASRADCDQTVDRFWDAGVRHFVALRGDPSGGPGTPFEPHPHGYTGGAELVAAIKRRHPTAEVTVSAYPERHPDSASFAQDLDALQAKVDAGADRAITQFFFDNHHYLDYVERVRARGITIPIVPGIMPVYDFAQVSSFAQRCGATVPAWFARRFETLGDDEEMKRLMAAAVAVEQVLDLATNGVSDYHFYTLNRADIVVAICHLLGVHIHAA